LIRLLAAVLKGSILGRIGGDKIIKVEKRPVYTQI
jgi:hypothetical protein